MKTVHAHSSGIFSAAKSSFVHTIRFLFILAGFFGCAHLSAQLVTTKDGKYGLLKNTGETILEPVYDEVAPLAPGWPVYRFTKGNKTGLYNFSDSTLYPCTYDTVRREGYDSYIIRQGNLSGYVVRENQNHKYACKVFEPRYNYVHITGYTVCLRKDSLYGLFSTNTKQQVIMPYMAEGPLKYESPYGLVYYTAAKQLVLMRKDPQANSWNKLPLSGRPQVFNEFIVDTDTMGTITLYNNKNGKRLSSYSRPADAIEMYFSIQGMCVQLVQPAGTLKHVTWYNPYTGFPFFTVDLKEGEKIGGSYTLRDLKANTEIAIRREDDSHIKFTVLGTLNGYTYTPFDKPEVRKFRSHNREGAFDGLFVSAGSKGNGYKWLWMGGR